MKHFVIKRKNLFLFLFGKEQGYPWAAWGHEKGCFHLDSRPEAKDCLEWLKREELDEGAWILEVDS